MKAEPEEESNKSGDSQHTSLPDAPSAVNGVDERRRQQRRPPAGEKTGAAEFGVGTEAGTVAGETVVEVGAANSELPAGGATPPSATNATSRHAFLVGAGILISRLVGLMRQRVFAYYFGTSAAMDAFSAAFRIPNFLQNVFGEGALSASFIPVYAKLLARGETEEARRVAGAVFTLLTLVTAVLVLIGILTTPVLIDIIAPGFEGETRELAVRLVKIFFPGAGLLVLSAWCLGVLNSHRRFFLSYTAPVVWNITIIAALVGWGSRTAQFPLAEIAAWAAVIGSALQFGVQLPVVLALLTRLHITFETVNANVRIVIRNFFPVFISRGVVQISAFVDALLASLLPTGAVAALTFTQSIYTLPVSLFGMSVSAAELPAMSSAVGDHQKVHEELRHRLDRGLRQIAFLVVPSAAGFLALGDVMAAALYQTGRFTQDETLYVWGILAGSAVGLLPSTFGRLYASTFYALHDTRTPLRYATVHVGLAIVLGYLFAIPLPPALGIDSRWGAAGLTFSAGIAGWVELLLLRRTLNRRIGQTGLSASYLVKLWTAAAVGAAVGWGLKMASSGQHPIPVALFVLVPYGITYFAVTYGFGVAEVKTVAGRFTRLLRGRRQ